MVNMLNCLEKLIAW